MNMRSSRSTITFFRSFHLPGHPDAFPAGHYQVLVEEELLHGVSFETWRRTATYLLLKERCGLVENLSIRATTESDLNKVLLQDHAQVMGTNDCATLLPGRKA